MKNIECPLCEGKGVLMKDKKLPLWLEIKELKKKGLTVREIAKVVGKGSTTVQYYLKKYE